MAEIRVVGEEVGPAEEYLAQTTPAEPLRVAGPGERGPSTQTHASYTPPPSDLDLDGCSMADALMSVLADLRDDGDVDLPVQHRQRIDQAVRRYNDHLDRRRL